jgi:hypothetical protein
MFMSSNHRTEVNRHLYFARLQLELAANSELRTQQQLPPAAHEQLYFRAALHFLDQAYQHYLLEIAEITQCKIVTQRAASMLTAWQADGWFSDQLMELAALEQTDLSDDLQSASWLQSLLQAIEKQHPKLAVADTQMSQPDLIPRQKPLTALENLQLWQAQLENLINRQRQFGESW